MPLSNPSEMREYQRAWMANRRKAWMQGRSCEWCGSNERLEIDHIDPAIKVTNAVWSWSAPRRIAERLGLAVQRRFVLNLHLNHYVAGDWQAWDLGWLRIYWHAAIGIEKQAVGDPQ